MIIILCTLPKNISLTNKLIHILLSQKLAACISILKEINSFYYWENKLQNTTEIQLFIKTKNDFKEKIFNTIKNIHPYKIPELLVLSIADGDKQFLSWMQTTLQ